MSRAEMDKSGMAVPLDLAWLGHDSGKFVPHICVCVCSYGRTRMLRRLLLKLNEQITEGLFTYSVVVADNDEARSASQVVNKMSTSCKVPIRYCVEPRRSIALVRNKSIEYAEGAFVALIDDDQFPEATWLLCLYQNLCDYRVDGVLGAVKSNFEETPPGWLRKSRIYARELKATGTEVKWKESRIGNALLKRGIFACDPMPFRPQLQAREDQDFFRRKIQSGYRFIWSAEGLVSETIAPEHWKRAFILRNAFQEGAMAALQPDCTKTSIAQSLIAVPFYTLFAPLALLAGQQYFMRLLVKIFEHSGKLLMSAGIDPKKEE